MDDTKSNTMNMIKGNLYFAFTALWMLITVPVWSQSDSVIYKEIGSTELAMRIYHPPGYDQGENYPAMVFFFGGGWKGGRISQFEPHALHFASEGFVCFLVDYRVSSRHGTTPFESLQDARSAIRYVRKEAMRYRIDPDMIIAAGGSAGGHLAAATALAIGFDEPGEDTTVSCQPNALVLFNPVIDNGPAGYGFERIGAAYKDFSPLHNIRKGAPPTIIFLGTEDHLIPVETMKYYETAMERVGSPCELHLYQGQKHGFFNFKNREIYDSTIDKTDAFLRLVLKERD